MNLNQLPIPLVVFLIFVFDVLIWCGVLIVIGRFSGWILLAQKYRATEPFDGPLIHWQRAQLRCSLNYGGVLSVGVNATGLYLKTIFFFRLGHPPLFIPWSETKIEMKHSFWQRKFMEVQFPNVPGTLIRFPEKLAKEIAASFPEA